MNNELLKNYFTDHQMADVLGMTVGGLRNKIYRGRGDELPTRSNIGRMRLWQKTVVAQWLEVSLDAETAKRLIERGEKSLSIAAPADKQTTKKQK
jgi:hypothetical protein